MIGSVSPAMHKYIWKPAIWVIVHKLKALFSKHPYSMYENKFVVNIAMEGYQKKNWINVVHVITIVWSIMV